MTRAGLLDELAAPREARPERNQASALLSDTDLVQLL
jgi:hypothetical protein